MSLRTAGLLWISMVENQDLIKPSLLKGAIGEATWTSPFMPL
jgi:hypothetical protein